MRHDCKKDPKIEQRVRVLEKWLKVLPNSQVLPDHLSRDPFPIPPVRGNRRIAPLKNAVELAIESTRQEIPFLMDEEIPIGGYYRESYVYAVKWPQRATLVLNRVWDRYTTWGRFVIARLVKARGKPVSAKTRQFVERWLKKADYGAPGLIYWFTHDFTPDPWPEN